MNRGSEQGDSWSGEVRATLALAWPLILSNLTMATIQATDVKLMGWLGPHAVAASALGLNFSMALTIFCMGLVLAASPLMAQELGRKAHSVRDVRRTFRQSIWVSILIVLPCWALIWNAESVLIAFRQDPGLAHSAATFLRGYMWSMLPFLLFQCMRHFFAALERPGWILAVSMLGIGLNALVSYALIFGKFGLPAWGLFGGGLGSSIVWGLLAIILAGVLVTHRRFRRYHLFGHFWRSDWQRFRDIWRIGLPIAITLGFEGTVFSAAVYLMGLINEASVAAHAVALQLAALTFMVPMGLGQAATVRVGLAYGKRDPEGISRAGWAAFVLGVGFMGAMALAMMLFPRTLMTVFIDDIPGNAEVIRLGVSFLLLAAIFQVFDGAQVVGSGMLRGLQDTRWPMIFAGFGYWVIGLGVGALLGFGLGWRGVGIWTGLASGLAAVALLMLGRWMRRAKLGLVPDASLPVGGL